MLALSAEKEGRKEGRQKRVKIKKTPHRVGDAHLR
jgi:hypothetical protein